MALTVQTTKISASALAAGATLTPPAGTSQIVDVKVIYGLGMQPGGDLVLLITWS